MKINLIKFSNFSSQYNLERLSNQEGNQTENDVPRYIYIAEAYVLTLGKGKGKIIIHSLKIPYRG